MAADKIPKNGKGKSVRKKVFDGILNYITENSLAPGSKLPSEGEMAETLNVSRPSLRDGIGLRILFLPLFSFGRLIRRDPCGRLLFGFRKRLLRCFQRFLQCLQFRSIAFLLRLLFCDLCLQIGDPLFQFRDL